MKLELTKDQKEELIKTQMREKYIDEVVGNKPTKTVEEALQEALDNTTPEHAGAPNKRHYELEGDDYESEWI